MDARIVKLDALANANRAGAKDEDGFGHSKGLLWQVVNAGAGDEMQFIWPLILCAPFLMGAVMVVGGLRRVPKSSLVICFGFPLYGLCDDPVQHITYLASLARWQ